MGTHVRWAFGLLFLQEHLVPGEVCSTAADGLHALKRRAQEPRQQESTCRSDINKLLKEVLILKIADSSHAQL